ncbi:terminal uridylyltransferase 7 isoform X2 [Xenopus laevis]|uniref:RNA uridylyltransferase n=1 Tax=Xenopus laevis TaxID=8355 RepID=A0A8J1M4X1_XENLA|nr:terminal uridylyltransferase 7 isoform X2 [Xenopus laevis]
MGDAAKQAKHRATMDEEEYRRTPVKQSNVNREIHGNKKTPMDSQKRPVPVTCSSSPRNGIHQSTFNNFSRSPNSRPINTPKEGHKRWLADVPRSNSDNWRDRKLQTFHRTRNDSTNEQEEAQGRRRDGGERSKEGGRRYYYKGITNKNYMDGHTGVADNFKQEKKRADRRRKSERDEDDYLESPVLVESALSEKELLGLQQAEERLKRDYIYRLKRLPRKYPTAVYCCKLCDTLVESVSSAHKHIKEKRHKRNLKEKKEEELLTNLPPPDHLQAEAITSAICKIVQEHGLDENDLAERCGIVQAMENVIQQKLPGCSLRLYGSSWTRFGFKNSDLNIDIQFPINMNQPDVLLQVQDSLKQSDLFTDFEADFHARVPVIVCREKQSSLLCKVSAGNENACLTSNLMASLGRLEPRLLSLVVAFRYWAKLCCIDRPEEGGLPPYVLALMVVFFLQQRKQPVLPVYLGAWIEEFSLSQLAKYSLLDTEKDFMVWECNIATDTASHSNEESFVRGKAPLVFAEPQQCTASTGHLWVDMLRFYSLEFNMAELVISIRVKEMISRESKDWPKKRIAVEDPYSVKRNVARSLNSQLMYDYTLHCLRATYKYFAMAQKRSSKASKKHTTQPGAISDNPNESSLNALNEDKGVDRMTGLNKQLEELVIGTECSGASAQNNQKFLQSPSCKEVDTASSQTKRKLVYDTVHSNIVSEDPDCIIEEFITCEPEGSVGSCEEVESFNDESEEEDIPMNALRKDNKLDNIIDQGLDEDSENGEVLRAANEETDSLSDVEEFTNAAVPEAEHFEFESGDIQNLVDEESTEGTDELEENPITQTLKQTASNNFDEEEDDEHEDDDYPRDHLDSLTADEDLEHTYTGSMDEFLSDSDAEEDDKDGPDHVVVPSAVVFEKPNELALPVTENFEEEQKPVQMENEDCRMAEDNDLLYEFNKLVFTKGKLPTVVCNLCKREGHLKKDCPEDFKKIELDPLPPLTSKFRKILDNVCIQCYDDFSPTALEDKAREHIRQDLEDFIRRDFSGARLTLFGSSKNGFGFKQSDLDICMTFDGFETAEELDSIRTIEELARLLRKHQGLRNILPITTAKVPIVKFYHVRSGLEGDISLYNTLALHNTHLLASYATIDRRVMYLCYILKVFTKTCDIGDASRGSLSSYAYTLMVLYFLQQRNPPVIPVLQEIYKGRKKPEIIVDGWNVYFFDKLHDLANHWPEIGTNKESVGELWLGLLRFYTEEFDFKEHVISIRRKSLLTTFKKQWTSKYIVIEDPFDLNHNLGAGLSRKMTNFIMKAFINGRHVFGTPITSFPKEYPTTMEYFFDPEVLTEGELAPNDRCCRICGKIGHFMKDCPMRRKARMRNNENAVNQRYPEARSLRKTENTASKSAENESSRFEGKLTSNTPKKPNQGARGANDASREKPQRLPTDKWRRSEDREMREKRCFLCGKEDHIKKECPQYKGPVGSPKSNVLYGSPSTPSPLKHPVRVIQAAQMQDEQKKQKMFLSPQQGSLSNKYTTQAKTNQKRFQQES